MTIKKLLGTVVTVAALAGLAIANPADDKKVPAKPVPMPAKAAPAKPADPKAGGDMKGGGDAKAGGDMAGAEMAPPKAGAETLALKPLSSNSTWTGTMKKDAMGPNMPPMDMATSGSAKCKWALNNLWIICEVSETMGTGKMAHKMGGHMVLGWDFMAKAYRSVWADTDGGAMMMAGKLEGTKFSLESMGDLEMMGQPMKFRITWDWSDKKAPKMFQELSMGKGGAWKTVEEATVKGMKM